jgi:hypothetical protein
MVQWQAIPIAEYVVAVQNNGDQIPASNPPYAAFFVLALALFVFGLFVLVFIRTSARGTSKH